MESVKSVWAPPCTFRDSTRLNSLSNIIINTCSFHSYMRFEPYSRCHSAASDLLLVKASIITISPYIRPSTCIEICHS